MRPRYKPQKIKEFGFPKLLLQLEIEYTDGHKERVVSDEHWRFTADGPIRTNNEYDGEEYDATKELTGWNEAGYREDGWLKPQLVGAPGGRISAQMDAPIRVMAVARPVGLKKVGEKWILDMGQNLAGWVKMKVKGHRGEKVVLRFGETLQKDGELYTANLRDARVTDSYTLKGEGEEVWRPAFVFHGFRYVEISGYPGEPVVGDFEGEAVYDDMKTTGYFKTDNELVNRIYINAWWSIAANYKGMPLDCPQRNERMPWLGDRATGALGESYAFGNAGFYAKWLGDIADAQKPDGSLPDVAPAYWNYYSDNMTWPGTYLLVADMLYRQYGDLRSIGRHYASMKKWLYYMKGKYSAGGIMMKDKYGDWCVPPESPELIHSKDSSRMTDGKLIATAYYYHLVELMDEFARQTGHEDKEWRRLAIEVKDAFNKKWLDGKTGGYSNNTVTANLLPLYFGMVPEAYRDRVFGHIVRKIEENKEHISTGVIGTQWLMRGLTQYGRSDLAWKIAANKDYPGWGYMVERGATTIWELWNGDSANPAMNSQNHVMLLGDLITWMYEDLAGIAPGEPGFKKIVMRPSFVGPGSVTATYDTPYGLVSSRWKRSGSAVVWNVTVPGNTSAKIYLPDGRVEEVGSGDYQFEANIK
jgi:alpha-L-rhamnosidase